VSEKLRVGRRTVEISNPDKLLFPEAKLTKLDLARYYERVAYAMLPHLRGRPLSLHSFPDGAGGDGFYVKDVPDHFPEWIDRVTVPKRGGKVTHALARDAATLAYLAGQNVITPHVWLCRADDLRRPDRLIVDLDPPGDRFAEARAAARALGELLRDLRLEPFAMTTGSRGVHVTVPLRRGADFDTVREFARRVGRALVDEDPKHLTMEHRKEKRGERIFVDVLRNAYAQHAVAPYAVRPKPKAPAATPLHWDELSERTTSPQRWTVATLPDRLHSEGDPWRRIGRHARALGPARARLDRR
jgi:bifunctional non-homologous end joining protein LigD